MRNPKKKGKIKIRIRGADRRPIDDEVKVEVWRARDDGFAGEATIAPNAKSVDLKGFEPGEVYKVRALPKKYRSVGKFVRATETGSKLTLHCPVRPSAVREVQFRDQHKYAELVSQDAAHDVRCMAGLLNIVSKMAATALPSGKPVTDFVLGIKEAKPDRIWFEASERLRNEMEEAVEIEEFGEAPDLLHRPPEGFKRAGSFKSSDLYGNLQLTFFQPEWTRARETLVEADIDDASGIGHLFQVLRNALPGVATDPYDIHEILTFHQELDTGYDLVV